MNLETFLNQTPKTTAQKDSVAVDSEWLDVCDLVVPFGEVHLTGYIADEKEGLLTKMPVGHYSASVKAAAYGWDVRVSRLRIVKQGTTQRIGKKLDDIGTDSATIVAYDFKNLSANISGSGDIATHVSKLIASQFGLSAVVRSDNSPDVVLLAVNSGFGDGTFPVHELNDESGRVGVEVVFIEPGKPYPFDTTEPVKDPELDPDDELHIKVLRKMWPNAQIALNQGENELRANLQPESPGLRAAFVVRFFMNAIQQGWLRNILIHKSNPFLVDEMLSGFQLFGANEYADRFRQVCTQCKNIIGIRDNGERLRSWAKLTPAAREEVNKFKAWLEEAGKDPNQRIESYVARYIRSHPQEFPTDN